MTKRFATHSSCLRKSAVTFIVLSLLWSATLVADQVVPLTSKDVRDWIAVMNEVRSYRAKQAEMGQGHSYYAGEIQEIISYHGFDAERWRNVSDRVSRAYLSLSIGGNHGAMLVSIAQQRQAAKADTKLRQNERKQRLDVLDSLERQISDASNAVMADKVTVRTYYAEIRALLGR